MGSEHTNRTMAVGLRLGMIPTSSEVWVSYGSMMRLLALFVF